MISSQVGMWVWVVIRDISKVCGGQTLLIGRADIRPKMSVHIHNLSSIIYKFTIKTDGTFSAFIISKEAKQPFLALAETFLANFTFVFVARVTLNAVL